MAESEYILLKRFSTNGDAEAFAQIIQQHAPMVYGVCLRILANRERAADVVQDTFFQLIHDAAQITGSLPNWLHKVATHRAIDLIRSDSQRKQREMKYAANPVNIDSEDNKAAWREISILIDEELENLDEQTKEILILSFFQGKTTTDIAEKIGVSQPTVSRWIEAGIELLRQKLKSRGAIVSAAILTSMLTENITQAAPASIIKELGKIALAGSKSTIGSKIASSISAGIAVKTKIMAGMLIVLLGAGLTVVSSFFVNGASSNPNQNITVSELLGKYAQTQDKIQSSFIIKSISTAVGSTNHPVNPTPDKTEYRIFEEVYCYDVDRYSVRLNRWLDLESLPNEPLSENHQSFNYMRELWDGKNVYSYAWDNYNERNKLGSLYIQMNSKPNEMSLVPRGEIFGRFALDIKRIDQILNQYDNGVSLRDKMEKVGDFNCYVIDADIKHGKYTLWFDPAHDYQIAKAEIIKKEGNLTDARPDGKLEKDFTISDLYIVTRFKRFDGVWIPTEITVKGISEWPPDQYSKGQTTRKVISFTLNPDFGKLKSFELDDIKNGANVKIPESDTIKSYKWQDGKVIDYDGEKVDFK